MQNVIADITLLMIMLFLMNVLIFLRVLLMERRLWKLENRNEENEKATIADRRSNRHNYKSLYQQLQYQRTFRENRKENG